MGARGLVSGLVLMGCAAPGYDAPPDVIRARFDPDAKSIPMPNDAVRDADLGVLDLPNDTPEELARLAGELEVIVEAVASVTGVIAAAEVDGPVPATSHPIPLRNVVREDVVVASLSAEDALAGAPEVDGARFSVPRILDED